MIAGTNGEAVTLSAEDKAGLLKLTREVAAQLGRPDLVITMGTSGHCTRDVVAETQIAKDAGADYLLVLVPSYFHFAMNEEAICAFFEEVRPLCWRSPWSPEHYVDDSLPSLPRPLPSRS